MNWTGKIIGMILGLTLFGPVGLIVGLFLGHLADIGLFRRLLQGHLSSQSQHTKVQDIFFNTTFIIMGYVAKSDGRVSENEIRAARQIREQMNLNDQMKREAIHLFTEGKDSNFNLTMTLKRLKQACYFQPSLLRVFLEMQVQMAYADGQLISPQKRQMLQSICQQLGVGGFNFDQFEQRFRAEQNYQRHRQSPRQNPIQYLNEAYRVLGVSSKASDAEVKKAYRRLMSRHHPDKLIAKGLPPEMIKIATQKTQQIKKAYEQICKARN